SDRKEALVIDPGFQPELIVEVLQEHDLTVAGIWCTHGHVDHIAGNAELKRRFPAAPLIIGQGDAPMLTDPMLNLSGLFGFEVVSPPADRIVRQGDVLDAAGMRWRVEEIPGHSPGHVVYILQAPAEQLVLAGDVLFRGSIGRTDFPGGDFDTLVAGIRRVLWTLPPETVVYPGHGPTTTIGHERRTNPFVHE
ncbi:MAG: MBL fold metallo-hydrolase, partial [Gemmataceae bacterium]|nr:MBL fold metallo-hydrolase [Gemmataceae bacterium]